MVNGLFSNDFPPEYRNYDTQYPGAKETIEWVWYDTQSYVSGTTTSLSFFTSLPSPRVVSTSNMELAGQLAAPKAFFLRAIRFWVKQVPRASSVEANNSAQDGAFANMANLLNTGVYSCTIGAKNYGIYPLSVLTAGAGPAGVMSAATCATDGILVDYAQNGVPDPRAVFSLTKPLFIAPQINFEVTLTWPTAVTLEGGDTNLQIMWDGDLIRPVQ
jgi:hypothetical protein